MYSSEWFDILLIAGFAQGIFVLIMLWRKNHSNKQAVKYLMAAVGMAAFLLLGRATFQPSFVKRFAEIILLPDAILFLIGPLLYFFICSILRKPLPRNPGRLIHYLPAFVHITIVNTILGMHFADYWSFISDKQMYIWFFCIEAAGILSFTSYTYLSYKVYYNYKEVYYTKYAAPFLGQLLKPFFIMSFAISVCWIAGFSYSYSLDFPSYFLYIIIWFLMCFIIYFIAYQIIIYPSLLQLPILKDQELSTSTSIKSDDISSLHQFMTEYKPYLEQEIKLGDLAEQMNLPRHELSRIINSGFGKNFFDFINEYRVKEFIRLRKSLTNDHLNTLELAFQAGFNSKSAFNRSFRKITGKSPRAYFTEEEINTP